MGRDLFTFIYYNAYIGEGLGRKWEYSFNEYPDPENEFCNLKTNEGRYGTGCAGRLLREGKMNY